MQKNSLFDGLKTDYEKGDWVVSQKYNHDGVFVDYCKCGVPHPNPEWIMENKHNRFMVHASHPCCGCCIKARAEIIEDSKRRKKNARNRKDSGKQSSNRKGKESNEKDSLLERALKGDAVRD